MTRVEHKRRLQPGGLHGVTVGILQTRHADVLAELIVRRGGRVVVASILREEAVLDLEPLRETLKRLVVEPAELAVFQTGVGVTRLFEVVAEMQLEDPLRLRLATARVIARGPKPLAALGQLRVRVDLRTAEPHTTAEVVQLLEPDLRDRTVFVQHHGEPNTGLRDILRSRGARLLEAFTYRWALPEDLGPVETFFDELEAGRIDVTTFTSAAQVKNLFAIAEHQRRADRVARALAQKTQIASIGPTTTAALGEHGLRAAVQPEHPKMVPLVDAVAARCSEVRLREVGA